jgi:HSP20 family protein
MTTATFDTNNAQTWKWISGLLAAVLAIFLLGLTFESVYLLRSAHRDDAVPAPPSVLPAIPHPSVPNVNVTPSSINDWDPATGPVAGNPWDQLNHLHQQMDQLFNDTFSQFPPDDTALLATVSSPNLDVREEKDHYTVRADMPGADKASIKVNVQGQFVTISGQRTSVNETKDNDKVIRSERSMAQFVRSIELPGPVKTDAVDAKYDNGVLTVTLPKAGAAASGTQVTVHG